MISDAMAVGSFDNAMAKLYKQAQSRIPAAISLPPAWLKSYEEFVTKNASQVSQIESALRSLSYIIPGRFRESELASESLHAILLLLSHYHTTLFSSPSRPSAHTRYTQFWTRSSPLYARISLLLRTIQYTELLCEMCAKRYSEKVRWRMVVLLEILKAFCRMIIMRVTGGRMGVSPPVAERESVNARDTRSREEDSDSEQESKEWTMPRTGLSLPPMPSINNGPNSIYAFLSAQAISSDEVQSASRLISQLSTYQGHLAELLWILRPVIYALAMQRLRANRRDWRPWALGLALELAARGLGKKDLRERGWRVTDLERDEWSHRGWGLAWWGMRGAFYESLTKSWIHNFATKLKGKPLLDMFGAVVEDYEYLWDEYYFSTATV